MKQKALYLIKVINYPKVRIEEFFEETAAFKKFEKYAGEEENCCDYFEKRDNDNFLRLKVKTNQKNVVALFKNMNLNN